MATREYTLTPADAEKAIHMYIADLQSVKHIASVLRVSPYIIRKLFKQRGIELRKATPLTEADIREIARLYLAGMTVRQLATRYERSRDTVKSYLRAHGVEIRGGSQPALSADEELAIVRGYLAGEQIKTLAARHNCSSYPIRRTLKKHHVTLRTRSQTVTENNQNSGTKYLPATIFSARRTAAKNHGYTWSITVEDMNRQYERQNGRCFYTGLVMKTSPCLAEYQCGMSNNPYSLSIDRRDSLKGYTPDNIVLCCRFANFAKNRWAEDQFIKILHETATALSSEMSIQNIERAEDSVAA